MTAPTSLPWTPPGYPAYTGYTNLSISDANKSTLTSLAANTDYKITLTAPITTTLQIIGGRNVVLIGGDISNIRTQNTGTLGASMASAVDSTVTSTMTLAGA